MKRCSAAQTCATCEHPLPSVNDHVLRLGAGNWPMAKARLSTRAKRVCTAQETHLRRRRRDALTAAGVDGDEFQIWLDVTSSACSASAPTKQADLLAQEDLHAIARSEGPGRDLRLVVRDTDRCFTCRLIETDVGSAGATIPARTGSRRRTARPVRDNICSTDHQIKRAVLQALEHVWRTSASRRAEVLTRLYLLRPPDLTLGVP
jgi:hypothetical protein